ncbi:DUF983 domain-containing protein [Mesorhizobium microcysteis]|uniref:DUF983 domain-containing protein n=1 Tax=Neoaquamicrobium microcysteis TaxID=2682781 RepID=A0A5D4H161_9HYPH|nr:DUF983 domain-containing protein [Mesorhizobium microcysteis]TYR33759.1 DUF983 domain-containing protein [Mesorhizobium microcysteis]
MEQHVYGRAAKNDRPLMRSMARGFMGRCPHCARGRLFGKFLKVADRCDACGEEYHHHRADDLPAYLVIFIVGHIVVGAFMGVERMVELSTWQHLAIWGPLTLVATIGLLQPVKGAVVGLQWALRMHGFSGTPDALETHPEL